MTPADKNETNFRNRVRRALKADTMRGQWKIQ